MPKTPQSSLILTLTHFIESCQKEKKEMAASGIFNVNTAMMNITISAFLHYLK